MEAFDGFGGNQRDLRAETENGLHLGFDVFLQITETLIVFQQFGIVQLNLDFQTVLEVFTGDDEHIMRGDVLDVDENVLDLGREDVHALDDEHIIGTTHCFRHTGMGTAAGTWLIRDFRDVFCAVTQNGHTTAGQCGDNQLSDLVFAQTFAGIVVDDLRQEVIFGKVHTVAGFTVTGNTRTAQFGHTVVIRDTDIEVRFDL